MFSQKFAKVVQQDWRDIDMSLIAPWDYADKLRPGTLVVACVNFKVYVSPIRSKPNVFRKVCSHCCTIGGHSHISRQVYVAHIKSLKVIATSDVPVTKPPNLARSNAVAAAFDAIKASTFATTNIPSKESDDGDHILNDCEVSAE